MTAAAAMASPRKAVPRWAVVLLGVVGGMGVRALATPWLDNSIPFIAAFPAVAAVAWYAGVVPAILAACLSGLWLLVPFVPPTSTGAEGWRQVALFLPSAFVVAYLTSAGARTAHPDAVHVAASRSAVRWLQLSIIAAAILPTVFFIAVAWSLYERAFADAQVRIDRAARVGLEHAARVIETNEAITTQLLDVLGDDDDAAIRLREQRLHDQLARVASGLPHVQSIWVWDANGHPLVTNRFYPAPRTLDVSDREYFRYHRDGGDRWFVTEPLRSRTTGEPFFDVTHARRLPDGRFAGAISVSLFPGYFTNFYRQLALQEDGLVLLLARTDGAIVARWPEAPAATTRVAPSSPLIQQLNAGARAGVVSLTSSLDGRKYSVAYRRMERFPMFVSAGISRDVILAGWYRSMLLLATFTFPMAAGLVFLSWVALRQARSEGAILTRLQEQSEQRERAEEALRQSQKLEAMGRLTGGVAHDFNNLLMVIGNNLHVLKRRDAHLADNPQLGAIARAVASGSKLTRQLLAFSRRQALRPEVLRLDARLPALVDLVQPVLGGSIEVASHVEPGTAAIEVDPAELELAILNLAINAKDAMPDGGTFTIGVRNSSPGELADMPGDFVVLSVSDSGVGIAPELQARVFEPFFTTKAVGHGTGLGLSQVYGFCTQAGGTARIESEPGAGTTVHLYFRPSHAIAQRGGTNATAALLHLDARILLVEDNDAVAEALKPLLETLGCTVQREPNADAALALLQRTPAAFDVVLSDVVMPGTLNGIGLAQRLRENRPDLPVVLMTGYAEELGKAASLQVEVLPKPCSAEAIIAAVRRARATVQAPRRTAAM